MLIIAVSFGEAKNQLTLQALLFPILVTFYGQVLDSLLSTRNIENTTEFKIKLF